MTEIAPADDATSIDPETVDPATVEVPEPLGARVRDAFEFSTRPRTYGEWAEGIASAFEAEADRSLTTDDLCDTDDSSHAATIGGETTHYLCAQDPLVVGLLADQPVTVESAPPNDESPVTIAFDGDGGIAVEPEGAVLSFGIGAHAEAPGTVTPEVMYGLVCPYGHAFPDDDAYEAWAAETDAVTDVLSVPAGIAVMAALIEAAGVDGLG